MTTNSEEKEGVSFSKLERAWNAGGTRRVGRLQVVDAIDNPIFAAYDFIVINNPGVYRILYSKTAKTVTLYRKEERVETTTRWVPVNDQNISKTVGGDSEAQKDERGSDGVIGTKNDASLGSFGHTGQGEKARTDHFASDS
jgi:hypothetical protein